METLNESIGEDAQIVSPRTGFVDGFVNGGVTAHSRTRVFDGCRQHRCPQRLCFEVSSESFTWGHDSLFRVSPSHLVNCAFFFF